MREFSILDCTLRDGGYCNEWNFGRENIKKIIKSLNDASIEIIECGFMTNRIEYDENKSKFTSIDQLKNLIRKRDNGIYVVMINYGEYNVDELPQYDGSSIDGIRVAFHKKDYKEAMDVCKRIREKGYKVFIQPMVSMTYTDEEFIELIKLANEFKPYAFYIVDSFGAMKRNELIRLYYLVEHNLDKSIWIGFHSHNNIQLAYSNAQSLIEISANRRIIIDSSIYGMGRGAGNLNTELFVQYVNENYGEKYQLKPLLNVIDLVLNDIYQENYWGYSLPNYLSASHMVHPNYAGFLSDKNTLTAEAMEEIFTMMSSDKKISYDKCYAEEIYLKYMETGRTINVHKKDLLEKVKNKNVLLIAPGKSIIKNQDKISSFIKEVDTISVSINFDYEYMDTDFIFISNLRRFREINQYKRKKCIITSNIPADEVYYQTNYHNLLMPIEFVRDNAGLMAIKFFKELGAKKIILAGFDGYNHEDEENYVSKQMKFITKNAIIDAMNEGMKEMIEDFSNKTEIIFITESRFDIRRTK